MIGGVAYNLPEPPPPRSDSGNGQPSVELDSRLMSNRQVVVLGTASQAPTRHRAHNGFVVRWDDQLIMFDPGEGTQRQAILAGIAIARLTAVCLTHFHGDHCLGLPGVIQRRALDARSSTNGLPELPVYFPGDGRHYFDRLRTASEFHDTSRVRPEPIETDGPIGTLGDLTLTARALTHRTTTYGYRLEEAPRRRFDRAELQRLGIAGRAVGLLAQEGSIQTTSGRVDLEAVSEVLPGQSLAFVMDTAPCQAAVELARDVDLLVCESTYLESEAELARDYFHMTAGQAATIASKAGARRLVLGHFSARYPDSDVFAAEAAPIHSDVVVASDLAVVDVPSR